MVVAGAENLKISQMDTEAAFTNGVLERETNHDTLQPLYMEQDRYFQEDPDNRPRIHWVCELLKALYGTKQGARLWRELVHDHMQSEHMIPSKIMDCVYFGMRVEAPYDAAREHLRGIRSVTVVTDDFAISHSEDSVGQRNYDAFVTRFLAKYAGTDMGAIEWYCSLQIRRAKTGVYSYNHAQYIDGMLHKQRITEIPGQDSPFSPHTMDRLNKYSRTDKEACLGDIVDITEYRSIVGALQYPAHHSTPAATATAGILAQYMSEGHVRTEHMQAARHLAGYLKQHKHAEMVMEPGNMKVTSGADAGYASCIRTRRSRTGLWVKVGGATVLWKSYMQNGVAKCPAESEVRASSDAAKEVKCVQMHMDEYGYLQDEPTPVECDCDPAISTINGNAPMSALRYLDVDARFAQEARQAGIVKMVKVPGDDNTADVLTKASKDLTHQQVQLYTQRLMGATTAAAAGV